MAATTMTTIWVDEESDVVSDVPSVSCNLTLCLFISFACRLFRCPVLLWCMLKGVYLWFVNWSSYSRRRRCCRRRSSMNRIRNNRWRWDQWGRCHSSSDWPIARRKGQVEKSAERNAYSTNSKSNSSQSGIHWYSLDTKVDVWMTMAGVWDDWVYYNWLERDEEMTPGASAKKRIFVLRWSSFHWMSSRQRSLEPSSATAPSCWPIFECHATDWKRRQNNIHTTIWQCGQKEIRWIYQIRYLNLPVYIYAV